MFKNRLFLCGMFAGLGVMSGLSASPGGQEVIGELGGIPMHRIAVETRAHAAVEVKIDGQVTESVWQGLATYDNMIVAVPGTGEPGSYPTDIRVFATEKGFFVSAVMQQPVASLVKRLTPRDQFIDRDTFGFTLDTTGNGLFAYWFIVALGDAH